MSDSEVYTLSDNYKNSGSTGSTGSTGGPEAETKPVDLGPPIRAEVVVHFRRVDGSCVRYERNLALEVPQLRTYIDAVLNVLNGNAAGDWMPIEDRPCGSECVDHGG
jgi:hypothetical protein